MFISVSDACYRSPKLVHLAHWPHPRLSQSSYDSKTTAGAHSSRIQAASKKQRRSKSVRIAGFRRQSFRFHASKVRRTECIQLDPWFQSHQSPACTTQSRELSTLERAHVCVFGSRSSRAPDSTPAYRGVSLLRQPGDRVLEPVLRYVLIWV